jgi:dUTP pyrophosphatase
MESLINVKFKRLNPHALTPTYAHAGDAGADLYSIDYGVLEPRERRLVCTGIAIEIPPGYVGLVHPRSGLAAKLGISIVNAPGTIDSNYRGEIKVNLINLNSTPYSYCVGDRIAQIVFQKYSTALFTEVDDLDITLRGINGHGSTGGFNG